MASKATSTDIKVLLWIKLKLPVSVSLEQPSEQKQGCR